MSRRDLLLDEMGLGPRWRMRAARDAGTGIGQTAAAEMVATDPVQPEAPPTKPPPSAKAALAADVPTKRDPAAPVDRVTASEVSMPSERRDAILRMDWPALKAAVAQCVACPLHAKRNQTVFGVGDERASWLFVGEGPGAEEDAKGEPFVGQAGRLLDNMLAAIGMQRGEDVYIANVVKCRPPNNRNPESGEMSCCEPYLTRQIELIGPKLIVAMGKIAASHLLRTDASIASLRGRVHDYRGTPLIVTYHPAYLLRTLPDKAKAWTDLCFAQDRMAAIVAATASAKG